MNEPDRDPAIPFRVSHAVAIQTTAARIDTVTKWLIALTGLMGAGLILILMR